MENYQLEGCIGEGIHGLVYKARRREIRKMVAIKKVGLKISDSDLSCSCFQELKSLQHLNHPNVMSLLDYFPQGSSLVLVMDLMSCDLLSYLSDHEVVLTSSQVKGVARMMLRGLAHCHQQGIMHRDLKPGNLLIGPDGTLKIGDFGQARLLDQDTPRLNSHQVATRWYRAPELLYGSQEYDQGVDLWATGCIIAETINRFPLFRGENDIEQLCLVLQALGAPDPKAWPELEQLPDYKKISFPDYVARPWTELVPDADPLTLDLLSSFLVYASGERLTARKALLHKVFFTTPVPAEKLSIMEKKWSRT